MLALFALNPPQSASANEKLAQEKRCLQCHAVDRKIVGPAFKDIATRYATADKSIETVLANKIRRGGAGSWGAAPMPAMANTVSEQEAATLARWVLRRPL